MSSSLYRSSVNTFFVSLVIISVITLISLFTRQLLPLDETRYISIAWEMWRRDNWILLFNNGIPYSDKPPLLFWLTNWGWWFSFGPNDWLPRLISPVAALICLYQATRLAKLCTNDSNDHHVNLTAYTVCGSVLWLFFAVIYRPDMLLTMAVLGAVVATAEHIQRPAAYHTIDVALWLTLGVFSKGPVVFLHWLPAVIVWYFLVGRPQHANRTYNWALAAHILVALSVSIGAVFLWAREAIMQGGNEFGVDLLITQTIARIVGDSSTVTTHAHPIWFYLLWLPLLLFPWCFTRPFWQGLRNTNTKAVLWWCIATFVCFSLVSGKLLQYLLPAIVGMSIVTACGVRTTIPRYRPITAIVVLFAVIFTTASMSYWPMIISTIPQWASDMHSWWFILPVIVPLWLAARRRSERSIIRALTVFTCLFLIAFHLAATPVFKRFYDMSEISNTWQRFVDRGRAVAWYGNYHNQMGYLTRATGRIDVLNSQRDIQRFFAMNPNGVVAIKWRKPLPSDVQPLAVHDFDLHQLVFWQVGTLSANPSLLAEN